MKKIPLPHNIKEFPFELVITYKLVCNNRNEGDFKEFLIENFENWVLFCVNYDLEMKQKGFVSISTMARWTYFKNHFEQIYDTASFKNEREYIQILRKSYVGDLCPYCVSPSATTLDHYYSKKLFPQFSIFPNNLIPACRDCNTIKDTIISKGYGQKIINPYYDTFLDQIIIVIEFYEIESVFKFKIHPALTLTKMQKKIINFHFKTLKIGARSETLIVEEYKKYLKCFRMMLDQGQNENEVLIFLKHLKTSGASHDWGTIVLSSIFSKKHTLKKFIAHSKL